MSTQTSFKRRISKEIRRFLFIGLLAVMTHSASLAWSADKFPTTVEGRINRNAFPAAKYQDRFTPLPRGAEEALRARIDPVLKPIGLAPAAWFRKTFGSAPSIGDRKRIIESLNETEIWKCLGDSCRGCSGSGSAGCVLSEKVSGGIGVVAVIHPCLLGEAKCRSDMVANVDTWAERIVTEVALYKQGLSGSSEALRTAIKKSSEWIHATSKSVNTLLGACPGPYPLDAVKFLREVDAITSPNLALKKCGQTYLRSLGALTAACSKLAEVFPADETDILRCDSFCRKMLCRTPVSRTVYTKLGSRPSLLILDGGCEGERPLDLPGFLQDAFPRRNREKAIAVGCLRRVSAPTSTDEGPGLSELGNGKEVQLVD